MKEAGPMIKCPCGSGNQFDACCGLYIGGVLAPTAEATMRSRYSAHVMGDANYLMATLATEQLAGYDRQEAERAFVNTKWLGLEIRRSLRGGEADQTGEVEFVARYRSKGQIVAHHELSYFTREGGRWVFSGCEMDPKAVTVRQKKIGRNQLCLCGSGRKYKKCCGL